MKHIDLTGKRFGNLIVIKRVENQGKKVMWQCKCDCGNIIKVSTCNLNAHKSQSCGCRKIKQLIERSTIHNQRHTRLYEVWKTMKQRCSNPKNISYKNYGGRGISVCEDWQNSFQSFYNWSLQNGYSPNLSIDRIDNNGNYEPTNCRWTNRLVQANNTRTNVYITINNKTETLSYWLKLFNIPYHIYYKYRKTGLQPLEIINTLLNNKSNT